MLLTIRLKPPVRLSQQPCNNRIIRRWQRSLWQSHTAQTNWYKGWTDARSLMEPVNRLPTATNAPNYTTKCWITGKPQMICPNWADNTDVSCSVFEYNIISTQFLCCKNFSWHNCVQRFELSRCLGKVRNSNKFVNSTIESPCGCLGKKQGLTVYNWSNFSLTQSTVTVTDIGRNRITSTISLQNQWRFPRILKPPRFWKDSKRMTSVIVVHWTVANGQALRDTRLRISGEVP